MLYSIILLFLIWMIAMLLMIFLLCTFCIGGFSFFSTIKSLVINWFTTLPIDHIYDENSSSKPINTQCCICLQAISKEVIATCNHSYCASCIVQYIRSQSSQSIKCPVCRQNVLVLLRRFKTNNLQEQELKQQICKYNGRNSTQIGFIRSLKQMKNILSMSPLLFTSEGLHYLINNSRVRNIILMFIYTLSPIDLLPEILLGPIGLADDTLVMGNLIHQLTNLIIDFVRNNDNDRIHHH